MYAKPSADRQQSFFFSLEDTLDRRHLLFALANAIRWETFGVRAATATCDRGYRGRREVGGTLIQIPDNGKAGRGGYATRRLRRACRRRAAIEPVIGHLKADHRLGRNFLKGIAGDAVNVMLAAAAFNFKRMMNKWQRLLSIFTRALFRHILPSAACHHARAA